MKAEQMTVRQVNKDILADMNRLLGQLDMKAGRKGTLQDLKAIAGDTTATLVVVKDKKKIVGMATLYETRQIGKRGSYVEDVVVDEAYREQGLGSLLMRALIAAAKKRKLNYINLTSRSERVAANKLYQKLGFEPRNTSVYRLKLK